jgi:mannitol/fructose-specific phosphotransferase system IIA component (Ntr-type)
MTRPGGHVNNTRKVASGILPHGTNVFSAGLEVQALRLAGMPATTGQCSNARLQAGMPATTGQCPDVRPLGRVLPITARPTLDELHLNRPRLQAKVEPRFAMNLADILTPEQIIPDLKATDRWQTIDELIENLVRTGKIKAEHREPITAVVRKRESSMSTGIGFGIGIPHASTDLISEVVGALGRSPAGVNFDALDNQPVHLAMLFLVPQGQFQKHLHTLASIAKSLHKKDFRKALEEAPGAAAMYDIILREVAGRPA